MKILLTGSNGLVGKNILEHPKAGDFEVLKPTSAELNLLNFGAVSDYVLFHKPDFVIHCAGKVGGIQANISAMPSFLLENTMMGLNLIEACRVNEVPRLLNLSSSCVYPKDIGLNLSESQILSGPLEPTNEGYALAKISVMKFCEYISRKFHHLSYKTIIPCNIYGRFDHFDPNLSHMIPAVLMRIHEAKSNGSSEVVIWGDGTARREFMYAADLADAIFFSVENFSKLPQDFNAGLGFDFTILEYYQEIARVIGYEGRFSFDLSKPKGMQQKLINSSKLESLGWRASHDLKSGLFKTYSYYLEKLRSS